MRSDKRKKLLEELRSENKQLRNEIQKHVREAEIEAALERVRARSMGMQKSVELIHVVRQIGEELKELGVEVHNSHIWTDISLGPTGSINIWIHVEGQSYLEKFHFPLSDHPIDSELNEAIDKDQPFFTGTYSKSEAAPYFRYAFNETDLKKIPQERKDIILNAPGWTRFTVVLEESCLHFGRFNLNKFTEDEQDIFKRLGNVFGQAYTRFLDLKKAEEQAREAQIEAALERVRARSMGMHHTTELIEVVRLLDREIKGLGIQNVDATQIFTDLSDPDEGVNVWVKVEEMDYLKKFHVPYIDQPVISNLFEEFKKKENFYTEKYSKAENNRLFKLLFKYSDFKSIPKERQSVLLNSPGLVRSVVIHKNSALIFQHNGLNEFSDEENAIFKRFGIVFEQAYTRFMDLQKAEEQARESQIEAALERVRSRNMGMQKSSDIRSVVDTMYGELERLGLVFNAVVIQLLLDDTKDMHMWINIGDGSPYNDIIHWPYVDIPIFNAFYEARTGNKTFDYRTRSEVETREFFEEYFKLEAVPEERKDALKNISLIDNTGTYQKNTGVFLMRYTEGQYSEKDKEIVRRFSKVFEQTYTRFLDLQKAEKQAAEAIKQASLDRVRGEIASMRSTDDLQNITPLIWSELKTLEVSFIRCGVFIIHEDEQQIEVYLSKPDGTSLAVMHLPFDSNELAADTFEAWRNREVFTQRWSQQEFLDFGKGLMEQKQISDLESYQGAEEAPESLHLHFIPFNQGMLYVGSTGPLDDEEIDLSESLAKAFSIAYARYEDFVKLEKAKASIEDALTELKATQSQLVQQEKLASLGQLTAGIAHEIKNPLNFVNNFSDLSIELVEEARDEVKALLKSPFEGGKSDEVVQGDVPDSQSEIDLNTSNTPLNPLSRGEAGTSPQMDLVLEILNDIELNLKKIHEHGTRADGIVKSMLQHSRGGSGKMEPTHVNALIKEYANLAFHGMRAGKDPINVDIELELDEHLGDVEMIAEDFSRVILNLCNNAFDSMRSLGAERAVQGESYEPKLTVRTKKKDNAVTIEIQDNGPGIPDEIKDKILQPFFTTKKGTAGTGLGLSITNDIVKAHGGEISIESVKNAGTTFTIKIPNHLKAPASHG